MFLENTLSSKRRNKISVSMIDPSVVCLPPRPLQQRNIEDTALEAPGTEECTVLYVSDTDSRKHFREHCSSELS